MVTSFWAVVSAGEAKLRTLAIAAPSTNLRTFLRAMARPLLSTRRIGSRRGNECSCGLTMATIIVVVDRVNSVVYCEHLECPGVHYRLLTKRQPFVTSASIAGAW